MKVQDFCFNIKWFTTENMCFVSFSYRMTIDCVEDGGCCDIDLLELVATGGLCGSETIDNVEELAEEVAEQTAPKKWQKVLAAMYVIGNFFLGFVEVILEGLTLNTVTSTIPDSNTVTSSIPAYVTTDEYGLVLWIFGFVLVVCLILPLEFWLLTDALIGKKLWGKMPEHETRDPYCLCFDVNDIKDHNVKDNCCQTGFSKESCCNRLFCKKVAMKLFFIFESIAHIFMSAGRFLFSLTNIANFNAIVDSSNTLPFVSALIIMITDILTFLVRTALCTRAMMGKNACTKYSVFSIFSFYVATVAMYCSIFNFYLYRTGYFDGSYILYFFGLALGIVVGLAILFPWYCGCLVRDLKRRHCSTQ